MSFRRCPFVVLCCFGTLVLAAMLLAACGDDERQTPDCREPSRCTTQPAGKKPTPNPGSDADTDAEVDGEQDADTEPEPNGGQGAI